MKRLVQKWLGLADDATAFCPDEIDIALGSNEARDMDSSPYVIVTMRHGRTTQRFEMPADFAEEISESIAEVARQAQEMTQAEFIASVASETIPDTVPSEWNDN